MDGTQRKVEHVEMMRLVLADTWQAFGIGRINRGIEALPPIMPNRVSVDGRNKFRARINVYIWFWGERERLSVLPK